MRALSHLPSLDANPARDWPANNPLGSGELQASKYSVGGGGFREREIPHLFVGVLEHE